VRVQTLKAPLYFKRQIYEFDDEELIAVDFSLGVHAITRFYVSPLILSGSRFIFILYYIFVVHMLLEFN
jgi:hypothetical protein